MVALKRWRENLPDGTIVVKQERRGGIETGEGDEDTPSRRKKQERRGGIETSGLSSPRTRERYAAALSEFADWYRQTFGESPDPELLTEVEVRDYISHLQTARRLSPSSIHIRLAALRGLARGLGRTLRVKGPRLQRPPVRALSARDLGRLLKAAEGEDWIRKRNVAILSLMARAGLRVGEAVALELDDVELFQSHAGSIEA